MKTATGVECLFGKGDDDQMEDKKQKDKKDEPFIVKHELILGVISIIILFGIAIFVWGLDPNAHNSWECCIIDANAFDTNNTDTNSDTNGTITPAEVDFLKQIAGEEWCMNQYLHRRPILYINAIDNNTGVQTRYSLQEAIDLNLVQDNTKQEIYMENIGKTGLLCGNYLYFDFRSLYNICLQIPDQNREECFQTETLEMEKWVKLYPDLNTSDTNGDVV